MLVIDGVSFFQNYEKIFFFEFYVPGECQMVCF